MDREREKVEAEVREERWMEGWDGVREEEKGERRQSVGS